MISPIEIVFYLAGAVAFFSLCFAVTRLMTPLLALIEEIRLLVPVVRSSAENLDSVLDRFGSRKPDTTEPGGSLRAFGSVVADAILRKR